MRIVKAPLDMAAVSGSFRSGGRSLGFVPTMGALHEGHLSLVEAAKRENDAVAVSIFINPAQFGPSEDYGRYPRDAEGDIRKLERLGTDVVFMPENADFYPGGFRTVVEVKGLADRLCGTFRPGHFAGVATVVAKLLTIVRPDRAYFGQKDYQQTLIVRRLVEDLNLGVRIVVCPTVREADGLAMSSRNRYLSGEERRAAALIYLALRDIAGRIAAGDVTGGVGNALREYFSPEPLIGEIQYASAYDPETLDELDHIPRGAPVLLAVAVMIGTTRLIDNMLLGGYNVTAHAREQGDA